MSRGEQQSEDRHRQCAVTRIRRPLEHLIRFVRAPDQTVVPDLKCRLEGRGVWVTCSAEAVALAVKRNIFTAGFRSPTKAESDLPARVDGLLTRFALQAFGFAKKAGEVLTGYQKLDSALETQGIIGLIHGSDAARDGVQKLNRKFLARTGDGAPILTCFTIEELSLAFGRSNVVHAALLDGGASRSAVKAVARLAQYRTGNLSDMAA
ncbi:MAG: RNA-binding protein [Methyloligellaceae bacterium]